jgi:hypothetical protein
MSIITEKGRKRERKKENEMMTTRRSLKKERRIETYHRTRNNKIKKKSGVPHTFLSNPDTFSLSLFSCLCEHSTHSLILS